MSLWPDPAQLFLLWGINLWVLVPWFTALCPWVCITRLMHPRTLCSAAHLLPLLPQTSSDACLSPSLTVLSLCIAARIGSTKSILPNSSPKLGAAFYLHHHPTVPALEVVSPWSTDLLCLHLCAGSQQPPFQGVSGSCRGLAQPAQCCELHQCDCLTQCNSEHHRTLFSSAGAEHVPARVAEPG